MADLDKERSTQTVGEGAEREPHRITPEMAKRIAKERRDWKRREQLRKWEATNPLYWIIDQKPDDYPGHIDYDRATTRAQRKRARLRSWFSWPNLGRLAEKEIFGVGLGAVMLVPAAGGLLDIVEPFLTRVVPGFSGLGLPIQAKVLFFSGLCFVIGNALYFFRCPAIIKMASSHAANPPRPPMFEKIVANEAAFFLSQFVDAAFLTRKALQENDDTVSAHQPAEKPYSPRVIKPREAERQMCEHYLSKGFALPRVGFDSYGMYIAEKFLLGSAGSRGGRLFVKSGRSRPWEAIQEARFVLGSKFHIYRGLLHYPRFGVRDVEGANEKDMFLEWFLADATQIPDMERGGRRPRYVDYLLHGFHQKYLDGCDFDKMANLLAEWQYYQRPGSRIAVAAAFVAALGLLTVFLVLQTANVLRL